MLPQKPRLSSGYDLLMQKQMPSDISNASNVSGMSILNARNSKNTSLIPNSSGGSSMKAISGQIDSFGGGNPAGRIIIIANPDGGNFGHSIENGDQIRLVHQSMQHESAEEEKK